MSDSNEINQNWKEDFFFEKNLQQLTLLKYFIRLIRFLVSEIKEYEIILRPHPNERIEDWEKFLNIKSDHFKIIKKGSLSEFIYYSDMIIQNGCTSSLEAAIMKKKKLFPLNLLNLIIILINF